ncbi:hypothetical protein P43SY_009166 [Pythium insidiosum]|uniref:Uncharacterized protein n=1 Tax=Pythium insidiosum TaxID=114742 RepID=A0AAD5M9Q6_PYTIN|nr:hypothetical protein P43SY_009166 [Pythium insidiosum]
MATTTTGSSAVAALLQKASQQYLECRRKVSAKVDEVESLDSQIQALFQQITTLGESSSQANKSVGRLELSITEVQGDAPVEGAVISLEIDPEYEEPAPVEPAQKAAEEEKVEETKTEEAAEKEDADESENVEKEDEDEEAPKAEEAEEADEAEKEAPDADEDKKEADAEEPKAPRSVVWSDADAFPATFVFDPVQSREAVVTISVSAPSNENEDEDAEPVKEIEIPVSSLFQSGSLDHWYEVKEDVEVVVEETTITEVIEEEVSAEEEGDKAAEEEAEAEKEPKEDEADAEEREATEDSETVVETIVETTEKVVKTPGSRFHVKATFTLSEVEKLSQAAVALSKQKQEAEAALAVLEREAASLRTKYERLNASMRSLGNAQGGAKSRASLLGATGLGAAPRAPKSRYQKMKDSVAAVLTPQRQQVLTSVAIFVGSVTLFHFQGQNLLA